jgi:hypothetical protein
MSIPITGETWGDQIDPVRAFLRAESDEPFAVLVPKAEQAHRDLRAALDGVSEAQAEFRPGVGEGEDAWGIAEVLRHIISVENIMAERLRALGAGAPLNLKPGYAGYMEDVETRHLPELITAVTSSRETLLAAIREIDGHERLDTVNEHRRFGDLNCRGWLAMHTLHLADHARQIGKIKQLAGYPAA